MTRTLSLNRLGLPAELARVTAVVVPPGIVDPAASTVESSAATTPAGTAVTITVTVVDTASGAPVVGATVVLSASGTGNTLTQPGAVTDENGVATGTFASSVAEAKTISATANGTAITDTAVVTVEAVGGGVTPVLEEDFSTYADTADMLADPRGIYDAEDAQATQIVLDATDGYAGLAQCMRYDWPDRSGVCTDYTIGRNITLPSALTEVWVEVAVKFSAVWSTVNAGCGGISNPDYKFVFARINGLASRFETVLGNSGNAIINGYPTNEEADTLVLGLSDLVDDAWHVFRWHWRVGSGTGVARLWIDGVLQSDLTAIDTGATTNIYGLALGRNMNQGPDQPQSLKWGRVRIYNSDPGWA